MYWRYSSKVVAPKQCNSPRANAGFNILPASIAPSALPAPTKVWISSMKMMVWPSSLDKSFNTAFKRSSNSPRNFAPAIKLAKSNTNRRLPFKDSGTSSLTMRCAKPSTMAVLPTPGSPINTGLFLVRRCNTCMARRISSSRPMTGSSLPSRARWVKSKVYFFSASRWSSALALSTFCPPRMASMALFKLASDAPACFNNLPVAPFSCNKATKNNSLAINVSPRLAAALSIKFKVFCNSRLGRISPPWPVTLGKPCIMVCTSPCKRATSTRACCNKDWLPPSKSSSNTFKTCTASR